MCNKALFLFIFITISSCSTTDYLCVDHGGLEYCTKKHISINRSFKKKLFQQDLLVEGNVSKKWNVSILKVHRYLKKYKIPSVMLIDSTIRKPVQIAARITDDGSFYRTDILQNDNRNNIENSLDEAMKYPTTAIIFDILLRSNSFSKVIENKYISGTRKIYDCEKTKVDAYGNICIDRKFNNILSDSELGLVMIHEAFHLFPISYENNIILRKYMNINLRKNLTPYKNQIIQQSNNNKYFSISYSEIFNDNTLVDVYNRESQIDFNVINYMKRNNLDCNNYINIMKKIRITGSRLEFSRTYCDKINNGANIRIIETYHDLLISEINHKIKTNKSHYGSIKSIEVLLNTYLNSNLNSEKYLAIKLINEKFKKNITLMEDKKFKDLLAN